MSFAPYSTNVHFDNSTLGSQGSRDFRRMNCSRAALDERSESSSKYGSCSTFQNFSISRIEEISKDIATYAGGTLTTPFKHEWRDSRDLVISEDLNGCRHSTSLHSAIILTENHPRADLITNLYLSKMVVTDRLLVRREVFFGFTRCGAITPLPSLADDLAPVLTIPNKQQYGVRRDLTIPSNEMHV